MREVRTQKGKLVGTVESQTNSLHIKDGKKTTMIEIPDNGLKIRFVSGNGTAEEVFIPSLRSASFSA
jgi:sporulation protein YlmC with PRC-barrel domain